MLKIIVLHYQFRIEVDLQWRRVILYVSVSLIACMAIKFIESAAGSSHSNIDYIFISTLLEKDPYSTRIGSGVWKALPQSCKQYFKPDSTALWNAPFTLHTGIVSKTQDVALSSLSRWLHPKWQEYCLLFRSQSFSKESPSSWFGWGIEYPSGRESLYNVLHGISGHNSMKVHWSPTENYVQLQWAI